MAGSSRPPEATTQTSASPPSPSPPRPPPPRVPNREVLLRGARGIAESARGAGLIGAAFGATTEAATNIKPLIQGEIGGVRFVGRVLGAASSAGSTTVAKATAALALREAVMSIAGRLGAETIRRVARSGPGAAVAFASVNQAINTTKLVRGGIDRREYGCRTTENVGATSAGFGGAVVGAAIGSVLPGPGTVVGAILGSIAGGMAGARGGRTLGEMLFGDGSSSRIESPASGQSDEDPLR